MNDSVLRKIAPTAEKEGKLMVGIHQLCPDPEQPRKEFNENDLVELGQGIKSEGQKQPIQVKLLTHHFHGETKYEIIDGERRWRACQKSGISSVWILIIEPSTRADQHLTSLILNFHRSPHTHMEISNALHYQYALAPLSDRKTVQELVLALGKSTAWIYQYLSLQKLTPHLQELMSPTVPEKKRLRFNVAYSLSALPAENQEAGYNEVVAEPTAKAQLRHAQKLAQCVVGATGRRGKKPSDQVANFLAFVKRSRHDANYIMDMPQKMFNSLIQYRSTEEIDKIIASITKCRNTLDEVITSIQATRKCK